ncbi:MAG: DUF5069 domain-containing protein [Luteolibacter sp.]|jgi:hypothetical protein|nr:DUF5069 domain-containing protein [Luteolibacter sp.]
MHWNDHFLALFDRCVATYQAGNHNFVTYYGPEDLAFLAQIGCLTREFFDFVEDFCEDGTPSATTALLIAAVRRDYFLSVQGGTPGAGPDLTRDDVPSFGEALVGFHYLPRILAKARAKLRGTLDPDLMFGCGGDRNFLRKHGDIHPADFLRQVWAAGDDDHRLAAWVCAQMA